MNKEFAEFAKKYKRTWAGTFMLVEGAKLMDKISGEDYWVTRKMDGILQVIFVRNGKMEAYTSHGHEIPSALPCYQELASILCSKGISDITLGAELYATISNDGRERVGDVKTAAANTALHKDLHLAPFDIIDENGTAPEVAHYKEKWSRLSELFADGTLVKVIDGCPASSKQEVSRIFDDLVVNGGSEGLVVHSEQSIIYKVKPRHTIDAVVIGYTTGEGQHAEMVRDVLLAVMRPDGIFQQFASTGTGFTESQRAELYQQLQQSKVASEYVETDSRNVAFQMVRPQIVVEMSGIDFVTENAAGEPKENMLLRYDEAKGYEAVMKTAGCAVHSPVIVRVREDKECNMSDVRISQLTDLCTFKMASVTSRGSLPQSQILLRRVFIKESGGKRMLQKYLLWKTNKEHAGYPSYVLHVTDYSPSRQEALKRDIRVSDSENQIFEICQQLIDSNVKKGWNEIG